MDVVERLRKRNVPWGNFELMNKAADEIERLRAALTGISIAAANSSFDAERMKIAAMRALEQEAPETNIKRFAWPIEKCAACGGEPAPGCVNIGCPYPFDGDEQGVTP